MITPAKWQAKGGTKNEQFRKDIVPHMSKIVFYPDCTDVFVIQDAGGICYFNANKSIHNLKNIVNICRLNSSLNDSDTRLIEYTLHNKGNKIVKKLYNNKKYKPESYGNNEYIVYTNNSIAIGGKAHKDTGGEYSYLLSNEGKLLCISKSEVTWHAFERSVADSKITFSSGDENECKYFISWLNTRFVRYLVFIGLISRNGVCSNSAFRFVPDPGPFDHIFTDAELYKKYNLTEEEINIIESVIKERKND